MFSACQKQNEPDGKKKMATASGLFAKPIALKLMKGALKGGMSGSMTLPATNPDLDVTYQEVQDFMVPASVGAQFEDKPGTFDKGMEPRLVDKNFPLVMDRKGMKEAGAPHNRGITWEKFVEHRGYAAPGHVPKHPKEGEALPDGKLEQLDSKLPATTLRAEVLQLAQENPDADRVVVCFDAVTCPFFRLYSAEDLAKIHVELGVPTLHVYQREAEPCDVFDAGGMHMATPLELARPVKWHKNIEERRQVATETQAFLEQFYGAGKVKMFCDTMDDNLEKIFESRPWRQYVVDTKSLEVIGYIGLGPFNHQGKLNVMRQLCTSAPMRGEIYAYPMTKMMMGGMLKMGMNQSMTFPKDVADPKKDVSYKEVQTFMVGTH